MNSLKELYSNYFTIGVACESIHDNFTNNEIGNPEKEKLILQEFNSMTFGNELKPAYNMGWNSAEATEDYLPFVINDNAKRMLDFARDNGMKVRGHVLVWHSQCANEAFCKGYKPVTVPTDPEILKVRPFMKRFEKLDPVCFVDRDTMLKRLKSYIGSCMEYMYKNGYASTIYAWDVVNEAIELMDKTPTGLRNSYWYQIIGEDFIYWAFKFAKEAIDEYALKYAPDYGITTDSHSELKKIKPLLFYNDYNEFHPDKKEAIIAALERRTDEHGSILGENLIDGIGMQGHLSDNNNIEEYVKALKDYSKLVDVVHITELDVKCTCLNINKYYYQAMFYKNLFEALVKANSEGARLKCVTFWGLTDDNSWKAESNPLIFNKNLSRKKAFDGIVAAATGGDIGEPEYVKPDYTDIRENFDEEQIPSIFSVRGEGKLTVQSDVVCEGKYALLDSGRTLTWHGASFDVSKFAGQTIGISAWVKSASPLVKISADIEGKWPNITTCDTSSGDWVQIIGEYKIPSDLKALKLYFETEDLSDIYIDALRVKVVGKDESFEDAENFASSRGVGHMPVLTVTDTAAKTGEQSLLVRRQEQDANVSFDVSDYIGQYITASVYVKTSDSKITLGIDGDTPVPCVTTSAGSDWTKVTATFSIPAGGVSAKLYVETDGNADMYVDDFSVRYAEFSDDVEGEKNIFGTRWGGAGKLSVVDDEDGKAVVLTDNDATYYGIVFDASAYIGNEVDVQFDAKTEDELVKLSGDIDSVWPNYLSTPSAAGKYKSVGTTIRIPSDYNALKMYVETTGMADLYLDNFLIRRIPVGPEAKVTFDLSAFGLDNVTVLDRIGYRIPAETFELPEGTEITGWYKDANCTEEFDFGTDILSGDITLYATDGTALPSSAGDPKTEDPSTENPPAVNPDTENPTAGQPSTLKEYKILDGENPQYILGSRKNIVIRSEAPIVKYKGVNFNKVKVPKMALKITEGSTIVEIDSLYLESLAAGVYEVYIEFEDGYSKTTLTIAAASENKTEEAANNAANAEKNGAVVKTGEVATPVNIIALVLVALGGALTVTAIQKKKNRE